MNPAQFTPHQNGAGFTIPQDLTLPEQLQHCKMVIIKQRQELIPLRKTASCLETKKNNLEKELEELREEYQRITEERNQLIKENDKLKKEIEKLTKTNRRYQVALFDHGNFKNPNDADKKNKGGQLGHKDTNRESYKDYGLYQKERLSAKACGKCGHPLSRVSATRQKILLDIVINPQIIKLILEAERQWCGSCKREVNARDPRTLPFTEYGINTFMMVMILRFKSHASLLNIAAVIGISHGLRLSKSDISNLLKQGETYLKGRYEKLIEEIRKGTIMYNDETGWLVHGKKPGCG